MERFSGHKGIVLDETPIRNMYFFVKKADVTIWGV